MQSFVGRLESKVRAAISLTRTGAEHSTSAWVKTNFRMMFHPEMRADDI